MSVVEEILPKPEHGEETRVENEEAKLLPAITDYQNNTSRQNEQKQQKPIKRPELRRPKRSTFSSHEGIFRPTRKQSLVIDQTAFASHTHISHLEGASHRTALSHHRGDMKLNPYQREDVFFGGSTYDLEQISSKSRPFPRRSSNTCEVKANAADFASQITIDDVPVNLTARQKVVQNLKKSFDIQIFKSATFCLIALAMTLHHSAFFIPYTYIISLTKDKQIESEYSEYLIICFGKTPVLAL